MSDSPRPFGQMTRRHWLGHLASTALGVPAIQFFSSLEANAQHLRKSNRSSSCSGWAGGPSHLDIWDLKPDSEKNGGPFKPIETSAPGVKITEHLPKVAKQMNHSEHHPLARLEGRQPRSRHLPDAHRLRPQPDGRAPRVRLVLCLELGEKLSNFDLPHCISINSPGPGAGFLGMSYAPFVVQNPNAPIANLRPPKEVDDGGWSGGCTCSVRSRRSSSASGRPRRPLITGRSTPRRCG